MSAVCGSCGAANARSKCGNCLQVYYCSRECQGKDWKTHKPKCHPKGKSSNVVPQQDSAPRRESVLTHDGKPVPLPLLPSANYIQCLHGAPSSNEKITATLFKFYECEADIRKARTILEPLSRSEIRHLAEATRSMSVDAVLDRQWGTAAMFFRASRMLSLLYRNGKAMYEPAPVHQAQIDEVNRVSFAPGSILEWLRKESSCSCLT